MTSEFDSNIPSINHCGGSRVLRSERDRNLVVDKRKSLLRKERPSRTIRVRRYTVGMWQDSGEARDQKGDCQLPYCGRYGCSCCTCKECGTYNGCVCEALKKRKKFIEDRSASEDPVIQQAIEIMEDF
jgi:hypothetical protein